MTKIIFGAGFWVAEMAGGDDENRLRDQRFAYQIDASRMDISGEVDPATDLDIITNTFRAIVDQQAFEAMIASWNSKLDAIDSDGSLGGWISGPLLKQLALARQTMDSLDIPADNDPLSRAIQEIPGPAIVLAPNGLIVMTNMTGATVFGGGQGRYFSFERVAATSKSDFSALMRAAQSGGNAAHAILYILPDQGDDLFIAEGYVNDAPNHSGAYVVIRSLEIEWTDEATKRLAQAFALSDAEAEIARLFFLKRDIAAMAKSRKVSVLTVRTQMKTVMSKTGASSQADLIHLLAMVGSRVVAGQRSKTARWRDPLAREQLIQTRDGRVVAWTWMGAENGKPVVMLRGIPVGYLLPEAEENKLREAGVTLYALSRPGYGNSTLHGDMSALEDNLACLRVFLNSRISGPCIGVGLSNGIVPLLAEQMENPARFSRLLAIGFTGVLDRSGVNRLPPIPKTMLRLINHAPWLVEMIAKSGHRMMQQHGVDWYLDRAYGDRPRDRATCADPLIAPYLRSASAHLLMQGHIAFVRDLQLIKAPIDKAIDTLKIPLQVLAPMEDGVYEADKYALLTRRNRLVEIEPMPNAGELVYYQKASLITERIIAAAKAI